MLGINATISIRNDATIWAIVFKISSFHLLKAYIDKAVEFRRIADLTHVVVDSAICTMTCFQYLVDDEQPLLQDFLQFRLTKFSFYRLVYQIVQHKRHGNGGLLRSNHKEFVHPVAGRVTFFERHCHVFFVDFGG